MSPHSQSSSPGLPPPLKLRRAKHEKAAAKPWRRRRTFACSSARAAISAWCNSTFAAFYTFREGRIAKIREIIDTFDRVQQVLERDVSAVLTGHTADEMQLARFSRPGMTS
jgi:hypothetical protein